MDDLILGQDPQAGNSGAESMFTTAIVAAVSGQTYSLIFPGTSTPTTKYYRRIYMYGTSPGVGKKVLVLKYSGTYLVIGEIT